jgi:hypothetical protein
VVTTVGQWPGGGHRVEGAFLGDITDVAKPGANTIEVKASNL